MEVKIKMMIIYLIELGLDLLEEVFPVIDVGLQLSVGFCEVALELVSSPLNGMFDLVREILQSTEGDALFRWVNRVSRISEELKNKYYYNFFSLIYKILRLRKRDRNFESYP